MLITSTTITTVLFLIIPFLNTIVSLGIPLGPQDTLKYSRFERHFSRLRSGLYPEYSGIEPPPPPPLSIDHRDDMSWNTPSCSMKQHFKGSFTVGPYIYGGKGQHRNAVRLLIAADGKKYAVKIFRKTKEFRTEIRAFSYIGGHENIVSPICILDKERYTTQFGTSSPVLVMEYVKGDRSTNSIIKRWNEPFVLQKATSQVLSALAHIHSFGLVHGDLKPANILINEDGNVKLIDFGFTHHISIIQHTGTPTSIPPEMISFEDRDQDQVDDNIISLHQAAQDFWSLGSTVAQWASVHSGIGKIMSLNVGNRQRIFDSLFYDFRFEASTFDPSLLSDETLKALTNIEKPWSIKWVPVVMSDTYEFYPCHTIGIHYKNPQKLVSDFQFSLWSGVREILFYLMNPDPSKRDFVSSEQLAWLKSLSFWEGFY